MTEIPGQMSLPTSSAGSFFDNILVGGADQQSTGQSGSVISSLRQSGDLVKGILADIQKIDSLMSSINDKTKSAFGSGGGGTHSNGMPIPSFGGGSGGGGGAPAPRGFIGQVGKDFMYGAVAAAFSGTSSAAQMGMSNDLLYNQLRTVATFNGIAAGGHSLQVTGIPVGLSSMYGRGSFDLSDQNSGVATLMGIGQGPTILNPTFASQFSGLSRITGMGSAATAQVFAGAYQNPFGMARARALGMPLDNASGQLRNPYSILNDIYQRTGGSSLKHLQADLTPYGSLARNLKGFLGIDDATVQQLAPLFQAANAAGTPIDPNNPAFKQQMSRLGLDDKAVQRLMDRGAANSLVTAHQNSGIRAGLDMANESAAHLSKSFDELSRSIAPLIGGARGFLGGASTAPGGGESPFGSAMSTAVNTAMQGYILKSVLGLGGKGAAAAAGGGLMGGLGGGVGGGAAAAGGASAAVSRMAGLSRFGMVGLALAGLGTARNAIQLSHRPGHGVSWKKDGWMSGVHFLQNIGEGALNVVSDTADAVNSTLGLDMGAAPRFGTTGGSGLGATKDDGGSAVGSSLSPTSLLNFAQEQLGTPYSWGGGGVGGPSRGMNQGAKTVGFDCSSFVQYVFAHYGVNLPRTTYEQVKVGRPVSPQQAGPGDLLFFDGPPDAPGHVGIYMGGGKMIEAPHTGASVRIRAVSPASAVAIRRVVNGAGYSAATPNSGGDITSILTGVATQAFTASSMAAGLGLPTILGGVSTSDTTAAGASSSAPGDVHGAVALGKRMAAARGWTGSQWDSLYQLWNRESGWNPNAVNKSSGAAGIPQALGHGHVFDLGDAKSQIAWGLDYIANRYKDPEHAWEHEQKIGWYDKGAWKIKGDQLAVVHDGEMVVPAKEAEVIRTGAASHESGPSRTVYMYVTAQGCSHHEAVRLAKTVKRLLDEDDAFDQMGSH